MKKFWALIFFACVFNFYSQAQDYIVTVKGDTFECKITKVTNRFIHFDYKSGNNIRSTVILMDQVQSYDRTSDRSDKPAISGEIENNVGRNSNEFNTPNRQNNNNYTNSSNKDKDEESQLLRVSFFGGYGYMVGKGTEGASPDFKAYEDELRSGTHFGSSLLIFPKPDKIGYGLRFNYFSSSNSQSFSFFNPDLNEVFVINVEDNVNIIFFGPSISTRRKLGLNETALLLGASAGYVRYANDGKLGIQNILITGDGFGLVLDLGLDIQLTNVILLNLQSSFLLNSMGKLSANGVPQNLPDDTRQDNSHFNLGAGLSFVFK